MQPKLGQQFTAANGAVWLVDYFSADNPNDPQDFMVGIGPLDASGQPDADHMETLQGAEWAAFVQKHGLS